MENIYHKHPRNRLCAFSSSGECRKRDEDDRNGPLESAALSIEMITSQSQWGLTKTCLSLNFLFLSLYQMSHFANTVFFSVLGLEIEMILEAFM